LRTTTDSPLGDGTVSCNFNYVAMLTARDCSE